MTLCSLVLEAFLPLQVRASFFLESCPTSVQDCFRWSLISCLGLVSLVLFYGLGTSFILLCLFGFEVLRVTRACSVGVLHFLRFLILPCLTLRTSMSPGRSSVLHIGSNPAEASSSGWTDGINSEHKQK